MQGSGKSSLAKALCGEAREHLDAHVELVECERLQGQVCGKGCHPRNPHRSTRVVFYFLFYFLGKRLEAVRQILQDAFEEAEWRQPSVVLLDDLDKVAGAPTSPQHDPEALLQHHLAQSESAFRACRAGGARGR